MKLFIVKGTILALPLLLWTIVVVAVDPFDYFNVSHVVDRDIKKHNAQEINTLYYHAFQEANSPSAHVLIGDSRTASLPIDTIDALTGKRHALLTASALKVNEITDLFWLAQRVHPLKSVYVGINFSMFNEYAYADRVAGVSEILHNPLLYIFNPNTAEAVYYVLKASWLKRPAISSVPPMTRNEFWSYMIQERGNDWYGKYKFPSQAFEGMKAMASFCKAHNIALTFVIVPHHVEFQNRLWDHGLTKDKVRFLEAMLTLDIPVIDYDYVNEITLDKANFTRSCALQRGHRPPGGDRVDDRAVSGSASHSTRTTSPVLPPRSWVTASRMRSPHSLRAPTSDHATSSRAGALPDRGCCRSAYRPQGIRSAVSGTMGPVALGAHHRIQNGVSVACWRWLRLRAKLRGGQSTGCRVVPPAHRCGLRNCRQTAGRVFWVHTQQRVAVAVPRILCRQHHLVRLSLRLLQAVHQGGRQCAHGPCRADRQGPAGGHQNDPRPVHVHACPLFDRALQVLLRVRPWLRSLDRVPDSHRRHQQQEQPRRTVRSMRDRALLELARQPAAEDGTRRGSLRCTSRSCR